MLADVILRCMPVGPLKRTCIHGHQYQPVSQGRLYNSKLCHLGMFITACSLLKPLVSMCVCVST